MKKTATLLIDTSDRKYTKVGLRIRGKEKIVTQENNLQKAQIVLFMIDKILKEEKIDFAALKNIEVKTGPGSFTGLRVGVAVANTLGFMLGISINKLPKGQLAEPFYS